MMYVFLMDRIMYPVYWLASPRVRRHGRECNEQAKRLYSDKC